MLLSKKHYVIDFPTNAANGTFRSIYWSGGITGTNSLKTPKLNYTYIKKSIEKGASGSNLSNYNLCTD